MSHCSIVHRYHRLQAADGIPDEPHVGDRAAADQEQKPDSGERPDQQQLSESAAGAEQSQSKHW